MRSFNIILLTCILYGTTAHAQYKSQAYRTNNWLSAHQQCLGAEVNAGWMLDMMSDGMEVCVSPDGALVMVDHQPATAPRHNAAILDPGISDLSGTRLNMQGPVEDISASVQHAIYSGTLNGTPVIMDQYVKTEEGIPVTVTRVIRKRSGTRPVPAYEDTSFVLALMQDDLGPDGSVPMLTLMDR